MTKEDKTNLITHEALAIAQKNIERHIMSADIKSVRFQAVTHLAIMLSQMSGIEPLNEAYLASVKKEVLANLITNKEYRVEFVKADALYNEMRKTVCRLFTEEMTGKLVASHIEGLRRKKLRQSLN